MTTSYPAYKKEAAQKFSRLLADSMQNNSSPAGHVAKMLPIRGSRDALALTIW